LTLVEARVGLLHSLYLHHETTHNILHSKGAVSRDKLCTAFKGD
jgi:hypothetical protein